MNYKLRRFILLALMLMVLFSFVNVIQQVSGQDQTQEQEDDRDSNDGSGEQDEGEADDQGNAGEDANDQEAYIPMIEPANFVNPSDIGQTVKANPYFLLLPGYTRIYEQGTETITVQVTAETKVIKGVTCAVVHDVVEDNGNIIEDTWDWYAQDKQGNVWYFGEDTKAYNEDGTFSTEGSWTAGVDNAKPGIVMWAQPEAKIGESYRQEYYAGHAEDWGKVLSLNESAKTPAASCDGNCLLTEDTTPLEPDVLEHKYYALGVGFIYELKPKTGETVELVEVKK